MIQHFWSTNSNFTTNQIGLSKILKTSLRTHVGSTILFLSGEILIPTVKKSGVMEQVNKLVVHLQLVDKGVEVKGEGQTLPHLRQSNRGRSPKDPYRPPRTLTSMDMPYRKTLWVTRANMPHPWTSRNLNPPAGTNQDIGSAVNKGRRIKVPKILTRNVIHLAQRILRKPAALQRGFVPPRSVNAPEKSPHLKPPEPSPSLLPCLKPLQ